MSYSLADKLYSNKPFTKTIEVLGRKVLFRMLGQSEEDEVTRRASANSFVELMELRKIPTLARAIIDIDGVTWPDFDEIKQRLTSKPPIPLELAVEAELRKPEYTQQIIAAFYVGYIDARSEYFQSLEGLKKNSTPTSQEPAG